MNKPSFLEGVVVAAAASLGGSVLFTALATLTSPGEALAFAITAVGLGYQGYLFSRAESRRGRLLTIVLWLSISVGALALGASAREFVLVQAGLIWLSRSLLLDRGIPALVLDGLLVAFGLAAALWAEFGSGSLLLALWSFFLVQALFPNISQRPNATPKMEKDPFDKSEAAAQAALRRLGATDT